MATYPYLRLTNGTTTITFADGATATPGNYSYNAVGWSPSIANRAYDDIDGISYDDVIETIPINITGSSVTNMYANVKALTDLLDKGTRWANGDLTQTPVLIQYIPGGSSKATGSPYEAVILGPDGDSPMLQLPNTWAQSSATRFVLDATLRFVRRGLWLNETDVASSAATSSGTVWSATLPSHDTPSPCKVVWTMPTPSATGSPLLASHMLITSSTAADIQVMEAELFAGAASWASSAVANARGGAILDFNPVAANTDYATSAITGFPSGIQTEGQYLIIAHAIEVTPDPTLVFSVLYDNGFTALSTPAKVLPHWGGSVPAQPNVIGMLYVSGVSPIQSMSLTGRTANTANDYKIDYFVFVRLSPETNIATMLTAAFEYGSGNTVEEILDHRLTTHRTPIAQAGRVSGVARAPIPMEGGSPIIMQRGTNLSGVLVAGSRSYTGVGGFVGDYRVADSASTVYASTFTVTRRRGYLVPE